MELRIHNNLEEYRDFLYKLKKEDVDLHYWGKYDTILISDDKCYLHFANTLNDAWELHLAFDKEYRGKKSLDIIKSGIKWMLDNKTPRIICGIPSDKLNIRMLANNVGFNKIGSKNDLEFYEIRR